MNCFAQRVHRIHQIHSVPFSSPSGGMDLMASNPLLGSTLRDLSTPSTSLVPLSPSLSSGLLGPFCSSNTPSSSLPQNSHLTVLNFDSFSVFKSKCKCPLPRVACLENHCIYCALPVARRSSSHHSISPVHGTYQEWKLSYLLLSFRCLHWTEHPMAAGALSIVWFPSASSSMGSQICNARIKE